MDYSAIDASDDFSGFGGWTESAKRLGMLVRYGANHWWPAIENYQANHPGIPTYLGDITQLDFRKLPRSRVKLSSPECTAYTNALGVSYQDRLQPPLWEELTEQWRKQQAQAQSRALVRQIPRATQAHQYEMVFVENVTEMGQDREFEGLVESMCNQLHYQLRQMCLNSMFFGAGLSRDRTYLVFARKDVDLPPDDLTVWAPCSHCHAQVPAWQDWGARQEHPFKWGDYGFQYVYRCPQCRREVFPPTRPASEFLDLTLPMETVARSRIRSAHTKATIAHGIVRFGGRPFLRTYNGHPVLRTLDRPMPTAVTHHRLALAIPQGDDVEDCLHRFVTADELKKAMSYRPSYILKGAVADQYTLVGNAVTPGLTTQLLRHYLAPLAA